VVAEAVGRTTRAKTRPKAGPEAAATLALAGKRQQEAMACPTQAAAAVVVLQTVATVALGVKVDLALC